MPRINFKIVAGNTAPAFAITCTRDGTAIDLSTASGVTLKIQRKSDGTITQASGSAAIVTAASGIISYTAQASDFPSAGTYVADVTINWGSGTEILYNQCRWKVRDAIA